jgi:glycosyltransferase involved in cell wall biosynthesis
MGALMSFPGGFTVLMAVYIRDDPSLFERAVDSVFNNTLNPDQFILVADGPLSEPLELRLLVLQNRHRQRIELVRLAENVGLALALNAGLQASQMAWVVRADADDLNLPHRFASLAALLSSQPKLELMSSAILEVDSAGQPIAVREVPTSDFEIRKFATFRNPFNHPAVAYSRNAVMDCGGYPNIHLKEDYALWCLMLARNTSVANTTEVLVHASAGRDLYRRRGGLRYAKAEWQMQKLMVSCGLKTKFQAFRDGFFRAVGFLIPSTLRGVVYELFLRKKVRGK